MRWKFLPLVLLVSLVSFVPSNSPLSSLHSQLLTLNSLFIYRYGRISKKTPTFCRFFAPSVLFFIKLFYLCTDFRGLTILSVGWRLQLWVENRAIADRLSTVFFEKREKNVQKFCSFIFFRLLCTAIGNICRCSSVGQSSWFVISWSGVRIPPSALTLLPIHSGRYQSGQMGQTVNLLVFTFGGSNPSLPTSNKRRIANAHYLGFLPGFMRK